MLIDKVLLNNYRVYQGYNEILFDYDHEKNITIISGDNGFGKTSFLTSLVWCLYGKLMSDVDEKYKREIYESGGYKRYCEKTINRNVYNKEKRHIDEDTSFGVSIILSRIYIPSLPCNNIKISRVYNIETEQETLDILIDDRPNELTKELGPEIFINDFILPREIAKFFFFDAEKIVSLAEMRSVEEKRQLSRAYSEVLGIKKYEDLKGNIENIRMKLRKNSSSDKEKIRLQELNTAILGNDKLLSYLLNKKSEINEELARKKADSDKCQERLIREGSTITLSELKDLKLLKETVAEENKRLKTKVNDMLDFAPFAIASQKFSAVFHQMQREAHQNEEKISQAFLKSKLDKIKQEITKQKRTLNLNKENEAKIAAILEKYLSPKSDLDTGDLLLNFTSEEWNNLIAINENLKQIL